MTRIVLTLTLLVGLARLGAAQTTPSGPVSSNVRSPVITSYPINGGIVLAADGTATVPGLAFTGEAATGIYRAGASAVSIALASGGRTYSFNSNGMFILTDAASSLTLGTGLDTAIARKAAGLIGVSTGAALLTAGTDVTVTDTGDFNRQRYQATITPATGGAGNCGAAFLAAALTADCTIATLPAGMKLTAVYADVTAGFTCSGTCTGTKVVQCGTAAGGTQILAAGLNVAVTGQLGLLDADLGSGMTRAAAIQGGLIGSWSATTPVSCRFTSGTGNWGSGAATFVNAGSIKFTLVTEQVK